VLSAIQDWGAYWLARLIPHRHTQSFFGALQAEVVLSRPDAEQLTLLVRVIAARNLVEREDSVLPAASVYVVRDPDWAPVLACAWGASSGLCHRNCVPL